MSSPAEGAKDLLIAAGVAAIAPATGGWAIKVGRKTETPDQQVVCYDSGGNTPNPKWLLDEPTFQVLVRGAKEGYAAGYAKAQAVKNALLGLEPQNVNSDRWSGVLMSGDINFLGYDDVNRPLFTLNFKVFLEPASAAGTNREPL